MLYLAAGGDPGRPARVGFVVSRAVGPAVTRNRVKRRLREAVRERLGDLPGGSTVVVRANPAAAAATWPAVRTDLDRAMSRVLPERSTPAPASAGVRSARVTGDGTG